MEPEPEPRTWHHGLVARYWAEFNVSGPEIDYFRRFVEEGPALDAACGTGRLLVPWLRDGLDVDGCDISGDMLALCRERAEREGLTARLYEQPLHRLDLPRRYRGIVLCGGFGLGGSRAHDLQALERLYEHLEPGGVLALDTEVPYRHPRQWRFWLEEERRELPLPWSEPGERQLASDGTEYELRNRIVDLDPLAQRVTFGIRAARWRGAELLAEEEGELSVSLYFANEIVAMLERCGFRDVAVEAGYTGAAPTAADGFLVFIARR